MTNGRILITSVNAARVNQDEEHTSHVIVKDTGVVDGQGCLGPSWNDVLESPCSSLDIISVSKRIIISIKTPLRAAIEELTQH